MIRYAVVGAEGYAAWHIRNIRERGQELDCALAAVAIRPEDRRPGQAAEFAAEGVEVFASAEEMFRETAGKVDGVFIPTGIYTHCGLTCAALSAGHNVYVEKPPAATVQEVDRMLAAQRQAGRVCALGFQAIYSESIHLIKSRLRSGALGEVRRLRCWSFWPRSDEYYQRNEWAGRLRVGDRWVLDGPSNNALSHQIANMLYLAAGRRRAFAAPRAVRAELYHARDIASEDTSAIEIRTADGPVAYFLASHCTPGPHSGPWLEIDCDGGTVRWQSDGKTEIRLADGSEERLAGDKIRAQVAALANFTEAVRSGDPSAVRCDLEMGRQFALAINGAFESAGRVRPIPAEHLGRSDDPPGPHPVVQGLEVAIGRCGKEGRLYSDIDCPWAEPTEPFELDGYASFPQRFEE